MIWVSCIKVLIDLHVPVVSTTKSRLDRSNLCPESVITPFALISDPPSVKFGSTIAIVKQNCPERFAEGYATEKILAGEVS